MKSPSRIHLLNCESYDCSNRILLSRMINRHWRSKNVKKRKSRSIELNAIAKKRNVKKKKTTNEKLRKYKKHVIAEQWIYQMHLLRLLHLNIRPMLLTPLRCLLHILHDRNNMRIMHIKLPMLRKHRMDINHILRWYIHQYIIRMALNSRHHHLIILQVRYRCEEELKTKNWWCKRRIS